MGMGTDITCRGDKQLLGKSAGGGEGSSSEQESSITSSSSSSSSTSGGEEQEVPDGGYGWVVVAASFLTCWTIGIIYTGFSILYVEFSDYFNAEKGRTGWIGSIYVATGNLLGFIFSGLINRYGCRTVAMLGAVVSSTGFILSSFAPNITFLYLSYGVVAGTGFGMVFMSATVIVQQYFTTKRALAAGLASSGLSMGVVTAGPIIQLLLDVYSWRGTLIIVAGLWLHVLVFAALFRPLPKFKPARRRSSYRKVNLKTHVCRFQETHNNHSSIGSSSSSSSKSSANFISQQEKCISLSHISLPQVDLETKRACVPCSGYCIKTSLFRDPRLVLFGLGNLLLELGLLTFYHHTPGRAIYHGMERHKVALLPTITGISEACARLVFGFVANREQVNRTLMFGVGVTIAGLTLTCYSFITSFVEFAIYCAVMGAIYASFLTVQTTVVVDILGVEQAANGAAAMAIFKTTGFLVSIPFAGFLYDVSGNYDIPFYVAGCLQSVGGALVLAIPLIGRCFRCCCHSGNNDNFCDEIAVAHV